MFCLSNISQALEFHFVLTWIEFCTYIAYIVRFFFFFHFHLSLSFRLRSMQKPAWWICYRRNHKIRNTAIIWSVLLLFLWMCSVAPLYGSMPRLYAIFTNGIEITLSLLLDRSVCQSVSFFFWYGRKGKKNNSESVRVLVLN